MSDVATATKIAALEDHVLRLLAENVRLSNEAAEVRQDLANYRVRLERSETVLESTRNSIITACTGSGCLNAHELRKALDKERDDHANTTRALHNVSKWVHGEDFRAEYPTATAMRNALITERERCGVLELALQAAAGKFKHIAENWGNSGDACALSDAVSEMQMEASQAETDTRHALDAAKFVGGGALARNQPCGCVVCQCEDDNQCQGCGAKHCGTHPVGEIPNKKFVGGGCNG